MYPSILHVIVKVIKSKKILKLVRHYSFIISRVIPYSKVRETQLKFPLKQRISQLLLNLSELSDKRYSSHDKRSSELFHSIDKQTAYFVHKHKGRFYYILLEVLIFIIFASVYMHSTNHDFQRIIKNQRNKH